MKINHTITVKSCALALAATSALGIVPAATAGETIKLGDDQSITIGAGLRTSVSDASATAANDANAFDASLDNARLYLSGKISRQIGATLNAEYAESTGQAHALDAYVQMELNPHFNVWAGQLLPPSDRANLDGPFYLSSYSFPGLVSQYPAKYAGRDLGVTVWGHFANGKLVYAAGAYRGHNRIAGASNQAGNPLWAGRATYNFWEVEDNPGYYTSSTYYGHANVLSLGVAGMYQRNGVGTAAAPGDYRAWNIDGLMERKLGHGDALTVEFAYYQYRTGGKTDVSPAFNGAGATDNVGGLRAGNASLLSAAYLFGSKIGIGQFQPTVRFQQFAPSYTIGHDRQLDVGINYIIKGHNARISLDYAHVDYAAGTTSDRTLLGVQVQL